MALRPAREAHGDAAAPGFYFVNGTAWLYDTTEVPSGMVFNAKDLSGRCVLDVAPPVVEEQPVEPATAVAVVLAVTAGALAQSVSGIGFSLVSGPLLVAVLGPGDGVRLGVVLSMGVNAVVLVRERRSVRVADGLLLLLPAALATPLWAALARRLDERVAAAAAGAAAVAGAAALAAGLGWRAARGRAGAVGAGLLSSLMNVVAAIGGPAVALWATNAGWPAAASRATLQLYFLGLNVVALVALGPPAVPPVLIPLCLGGVALGLAAGGPLARRVNDEVARRVTLALAAAGGLVVLVRALVG